MHCSTKNVFSYIPNNTLKLQYVQHRRNKKQLLLILLYITHTSGVHMSVQIAYVCVCVGGANHTLGK